MIGKAKRGGRFGFLVLFVFMLQLLQPVSFFGQALAERRSLYAMATPRFVPEPYLSTGFPQVVVVSGTDYEMGVQYGMQAAPAIAHNVALLKSRLYSLYGPKTVNKDMQVWNYYLTKYDPGYRDWLRGIVEGCKQRGYRVGYLDLLALIVYPAEMWSRPKAPYPKETGVVGGPKHLEATSSKAVGSDVAHSCNTFAATGSMTPDGKPIHGITSMVAVEVMNRVILVAFPKQGNSFICHCHAGSVCSNYAMNSKGLAWTMTAIFSDKPEWGVPPEVLFHYLTQMTSTIDEAIDYLERVPKAPVTGGFIFTDTSGKVVVYEGTGDQFRLRRPGDMDEPGEFVVMTNHLVHPDLVSYNPQWIPVIGTYARYDTVFQFLKEAPRGSVDLEFAKRVLGSDDWYDKGKGQWVKNQPGSVNISNSNTSVGQAIFFPASLIAYFQTGTASGLGMPAFATGEYVRIKLADNPRTLVQNLEKETLAMYWEVVNSFRHDLNVGKEYLTLPVIRDIEDKLDQAFSAYSLGMDRASFASLLKSKAQRITLWSEAMTYFVKAQLYVQMAKTTLQMAKRKAP